MVLKATHPHPARPSHQPTHPPLVRATTSSINATKAAESSWPGAELAGAPLCALRLHECAATELERAEEEEGAPPVAVVAVVAVAVGAEVAQSCRCSASAAWRRWMVRASRRAANSTSARTWGQWGMGRQAGGRV